MRPAGTLLRCGVLSLAAPAFAWAQSTPPPKHKVPLVTDAHHGAIRKHVPLAKTAHAKPAAKTVAKPAPPPLPPPKPAPGTPDVGTVTGMHLPRYAALKTDKVYMRSGPGERYPILWEYKRRDLPVKIEREFDIWRLVEDSEGIKGWMHEVTLTGRRGFIVTGTEPRSMRNDASDGADAVAVLKPGVVGRLKSCAAGADWCQVQVQDYRGWLKRSDFWGADPGEVVAP
jgi:SH3-like domain-containing protein